MYSESKAEFSTPTPPDSEYPTCGTAVFLRRSRFRSELFWIANRGGFGDPWPCKRTQGMGAARIAISMVPVGGGGATPSVPVMSVTNLGPSRDSELRRPSPSSRPQPCLQKHQQHNLNQLRIPRPLPLSTDKPSQQTGSHSI